MTQQRKSFSFVDSADVTESQEPIPFDVDGEVFHIFPRIPGWTLLNLAALINDESGGSRRAEGFRSLIEKALVPDDRERFVKIATDPVSGPDVDGLVQIATWMLEVYTGRPTEQSSAS